MILTFSFEACVSEIVWLGLRLSNFQFRFLVNILVSRVLKRRGAHRANLEVLLLLFFLART